MTDPRSSRNRLGEEPSLYLQQHATNPVDWYPWGAEALELAAREDRPILLSVGYSACHWCHVMERESFEDEKTAALMNRLFVCIKVDREERPDIDAIYMKAVQGMTGHGGWPMTVFLTPDGRPFFGGTYFPPQDHGSRPSFSRVLLGAAQAWSDNRDKLLENADKVTAYLRKDDSEADGPLPPPIEFAEGHLLEAARKLESIMDAEAGGFGSAPKFPGTMALSVLLLALQAEPNPTREGLIRLAFDRMASGGIYDHLGGGFHRYSVDREWLVPHFEKMLYDQALLAPAFAEAWKFFGDDVYRRTALGVLDYVVREMQAPDGGYYSAEDADSEGVEGKFFVWSLAEVIEVLGDAEAGLFAAVYDVSEAGNFESTNILHPVMDSAEAGQAFGLETSEVEQRLSRSRERLLEARGRRVRPARDEKILTDWNGLMIAACASVGRTFSRPEMIESASRALKFAGENLRSNGELFHSFAGGNARVAAFAEDFAFLGRGALEVYFASSDEAALELATWCADQLLARFQDEERGGFWQTSANGEALVARTRQLYDGAQPSANSVAAELLLRLWQLMGREDYRVAGQRTVDAFLARGIANPHGSAHLLCIAEQHRRGFAVMTLISEDSAEDSEKMRKAALEIFAPELSVLEQGHGGALVPFGMQEKHTLGGRPTAYVCRDSACSSPVTELASLLPLLQAS